VAEASPDGGKFTARQLTSYSGDDGQEVGEFSWLPDASGIVYVRGGDFENDGAYPNPTALPQGTEQVVWLISLSGGPPQRLGEGHSPAVSPKGTSVAFIFKGQVWLADVNPVAPQHN